MDDKITERLKEQVEAMEAGCLPLPQVNIPVFHRFAPNVYLREVSMPRGTFVIGHEHKTQHFNIILKGKARVMVDGVISEVKAPEVFVSGVGVRKVLYILEDMRWLTVHASDETDIGKLEESLIVKSGAFKQHELGKLKEGT